MAAFDVWLDRISGIADLGLGSYQTIAQINNMPNMGAREEESGQALPLDIVIDVPGVGAFSYGASGAAAAAPVDYTKLAIIGAIALAAVVVLPRLIK